MVKVESVAIAFRLLFLSIEAHGLLKAPWRTSKAYLLFDCFLTTHGVPFYCTFQGRSAIEEVSNAMVKKRCYSSYAMVELVVSSSVEAPW